MFQMRGKISFRLPCRHQETHLSPAAGVDAVSIGRLAVPMKEPARAAGKERPAVAVPRILQTLGLTGR
jgi:hypothetical protein